MLFAVECGPIILDCTPLQVYADLAPDVTAEDRARYQEYARETLQRLRRR